MRFEDGFEPEWREILGEQVSDGEARELLDRLAVTSEFGDGGVSISAVCEATGSSPAVVSRILADIRGVSWQEEFGDRLLLAEDSLTKQRARLDEHESKIELLSRKISLPEEHPQEEFAHHALSSLAAENVESEQQQVRKLWLVAGAFFLFLVIVSPFYAWRGNSNLKNGERVPGVSYSSTTLANGVEVTVGQNGDSWVKEKDGTLRPVRSDGEKEAATRLRMIRVQIEK